MIGFTVNRNSYQYIVIDDKTETTVQFNLNFLPFLVTTAFRDSARIYYLENEEQSNECFVCMSISYSTIDSVT